MTRVIHVLDHSLPVLSGYSTRTHHALRAQLEWAMQPLGVTSPKHGSSAHDEMIDGVRYVRTPALPTATVAKMPGAAEMRQMARMASRVADVGRVEACHLVHAHSPVLNGIPALFSARRLGVPVVYEIRAFWEDAGVDHGTHRENSPRYRIIRALETWLMRRVDAVGVIAKGLGTEVMQRGVPAAKLFHIPNGVDTRLFRPSAPDPELAARWQLDGRTVVGFIGSFYRYEGLDLLVDAWARIAHDVPGAVLLLIGGGETSESLRASARRLGIEGRTIFAGPVAHAEAHRCYSLCDVLVYPRKSMRLTELVTPLKPLEAMAAGKSVIASDVGGLRELIHDGETGMLFPAGNIDALAQMLRAVLRDDALRRALGEAARRQVCQERQWNRLIQIHVDAYRRVLGRGEPVGIPPRELAAEG